MGSCKGRHSCSGPGDDVTDFDDIARRQAEAENLPPGRNPLQESGLMALPAGSPLEAVRECLTRLASSTTGVPQLDREIVRLGAIEQLQRLCITGPTRLVDAALTTPRAQNSESDNAIPFPSVEPWPEAVDGAALLDQISRTFLRYVAVPPGASEVLALWPVFAHCHDDFQLSPILAVTSPEKRCGKTTVLELVGALVPKPLLASNVTAPALFRTINEFHPTCLLDEADTFLPDREEMRGILNSGHRRSSARVVRTTGDQHSPRLLSTWCPKVIGCIGRLPDTLEDRAIEVRMRRRRRDEPLERMRVAKLGELEPLRRMLARWALDNREALRAADPEVPSALHDRAADNWRPLLAIADLVGGEWPERARQAALLLAGAVNDNQAPAIELLADIRRVYLEKGEVRLASEDLVKALVDLSERPWSEWKDGQPMTKRQLATVLSRFAVRPKTFRIGDRTPRGYELGDFEDTFARYLPPEVQHPQQPKDDGVSRPSAIQNTEPPVSDASEWPPPSGASEVADVADGKGPRSEVERIAEERAIERDAIERENES